MKKIILNLTMSLDGFIEGPNGEYDWCFTDKDYGMTDFLNQTDTIFYGRKSYELMLTQPGDHFPGKRHVVFSQKLETVAEGYELIGKDWKKGVEAIQQEGGKDIWLFGGAGLLTAFMQENLVDEMRIALHPVVLGGGTPLFQGIADRTWFTLTDTISYSSGLVQLIYIAKLDRS